MAVRAKASDVIVITSSTTDIGTIDVFIRVANTIINKVVSDGCDVTDVTTLLQAEAYLAAHLLVTSGAGENGGGKVKSKVRFENYAVEFAVSSMKGNGILSTNYGEVANMLMNGCLSDINSERASIGFFG